MGHDVLVKRCGCGALLKARQSCARCANAARARLHAAGYCRTDGTGQPYDCGKPPLGKGPAWLDELRELDQHIHECCGGVNSVTRGTPEPARSEPLPKSGPALGERRAWLNPPTDYRRSLDRLNDAMRSEVPWSVAKADMQRRPEARYRPQSVFGVEYAVQNVLSYSLIRKGGSGRWERSVMQDADAEQARWVKLA